MAGCDTCEQNLGAELEAAVEGGEGEDGQELSERAQKVMSGEEDYPWAYGPLSSWGREGNPYCHFCHRIGHIGALVVVGIVYLVTSNVYGAQTALPITVGIYFPLALVILYMGRFPFLGAVFGPLVEKYSALWLNVCLTKKAEQEYGCSSQQGGGMPTPDSSEVGAVEPPRPGVRTHGTEVHLVATKIGVDNCMSVYDQGALARVIVENDQIVDYLNAHPNMNFNRFSNLHDHVGVTRGVENLCQSEQEIVTEVDFAEMQQSGGRGGVE